MTPLLRRYRRSRMIRATNQGGVPGGLFEEVPVAQAHASSGQWIPGGTTFFDRLAQADLPAPIRAPIGETLSILLENDGDTVPPDLASFTALLAFLGRQHGIAAPAIGVNREGLFVAVWQEPGLFRLSLEFPAEGKIHWMLTEFRGGSPSVRDGWGTPDEVPLPHRRTRAPA